MGSSERAAQSLPGGTEAKKAAEAAPIARREGNVDGGSKWRRGAAEFGGAGLLGTPLGTVCVAVVSV
jgi:hypothetical protein